MTLPPPRQARAGMTKKLPRVEFWVVPEDALLNQGDASQVLQSDNLVELRLVHF
jgi:hypothetical protein